MTGSSSKVARNIEAYGLAGLGATLAEYWTRSEDRYSLRDLATFFNKRLLESKLTDAGLSPTATQLDHYYAVLADGDVSRGEAIKTRRDLERNGVDVEAIRDDFVSHQSMHTYLRSEQGSSFDGSDDPVENRAKTLKRLQNRVTAVAEHTLDTLSNTGRIDVGDPDVYVDVRVYCARCGTERPILDVLEAGGCDCDPDRSPRDRSN